MTDYSENIFHIKKKKKKKNLAEIKNKFSEFNLFYKYLMQRHEIQINKKRIMIIILQKSNNK